MKRCNGIWIRQDTSILADLRDPYPRVTEVQNLTPGLRTGIFPRVTGIRRSKPCRYWQVTKYLRTGRSAQVPTGIPAGIFSKTCIYINLFSVLSAERHQQRCARAAANAETTINRAQTRLIVVSDHHSAEPLPSQLGCGLGPINIHSERWP